MKHLILITLLAFACAATAQEPGQLPVLNGKLPNIGSGGMLPPASVRVTIEIHRDGAITLDGESTEFDALAAQLSLRARKLPGQEVMLGDAKLALSKLEVLIRADRELPLAAVAKVAELCGRRDVAAPRVFLGVAGKGGERAIALFLPTGGVGGKRMTVEVQYGAKGVSPKSLYRKLEGDNEKYLVVQFAGDVPYEHTLKILDVALRAQVDGVTVVCLPSPAQRASWEAESTRNELAALVAATEAHRGYPAILVGDQRIPNNPGRLPAARTSTDSYVGFTSGGPWFPGAIALEAPVRAAPAMIAGGALGGALGGPLAGRGARRRGLSGAAGKATSMAIERGLDWLRDHQDDDGKWDCDGFMKHDPEGDSSDGPGNGVHDIGVTGLALLAFVGDGSTASSGPYKDTVTEAADWLCAQQSESGLIGMGASHDFIYDHAIATYALTEAAGLSDSAKYKEHAQRAVNYIEAHRNPGGVWRYTPGGDDSDTSVTGWCVMALGTAKFFDLEVNDNSLKQSIDWFDSVTDPTGRCGYTALGQPSSRHPGDHGTRFPPGKGEALTAIGLFCRFFLEENLVEVPVMKEAADLIVAKLPLWDPANGSVDLYYWYWGSCSMFQMGGRHWKRWSGALMPALVQSQQQDGSAKGSWNPVGVWGEDGGRVYATAMAVLSLESFYWRYTRLTR